MVVIRNVFQLKFGKTREAVALAKESGAIQKRALAGLDFSTRLLTDLTGPFYTLVRRKPDNFAWVGRVGSAASR